MSNAEVLAERIDLRKAGTIRGILAAVDEQNLTDEQRKRIRQAVHREVNGFARAVTQLARDLSNDDVELGADWLEALLGANDEDRGSLISEMRDRLLSPEAP